MVSRPDFGPMAGPLREALDKYSREELADLLAHIVRIYVVEGKDSGNIEVRRSNTSASLDQLKQLSFSQLILHLQMNLPHAELERLRVSGDRVWAERDGAEVLLCGVQPVEDVPPDWEDLSASSGPPRGSGPPVRTSGIRAATGPVPARQPSTPPVGTPRPSQNTPPATPASTAQDAGRVQRPSVELRDQPEATPPSRNSLYDDFFSDAPTPPPARGPKAAMPPKPKSDDSGEKKDKIGERSDRFSMLELD